MINREVIKDLRSAAAQLPVNVYTIKENSKIKGEELLLTGVEEVDGKAIDPEQEYFITYPAQYEMNHFRRMKKIYLKELKNNNPAPMMPVIDYMTKVLIKYDELK